MAEHYRRPGWFTKHVFNRIVAALTRLGIGVAGSRVLEVRGRSSGEWRRTPVNPLSFEGSRYLVAPRGNTQWVKNLRASGEGRLVVGRRTEPFSAVEVPDEEKVPLLREYLRRWKWEIGAFFEGVGADSAEEEVRRIAPDHPVFRIGPSTSRPGATSESLPPGSGLLGGAGPNHDDVVRVLRPGEEHPPHAARVSRMARKRDRTLALEPRSKQGTALGREVENVKATLVHQNTGVSV